MLIQQLESLLIYHDNTDHSANDERNQVQRRLYQQNKMRFVFVTWDARLLFTSSLQPLSKRQIVPIRKDTGATCNLFKEKAEPNT